MVTAAELVKTVLPPPAVLSIEPPLQVNGPPKIATLVPSKVPETPSSNEGLIVTGAATLTAPPPLIRCNPAPIKLVPLNSVIVPPPKFRIQVALALNVPVLEPPPSRLKVPLWQVTRLALLRNAVSVAKVPPADFLTVPSLLNVRKLPNPAHASSKSAWMSNI